MIKFTSKLILTTLIFSLTMMTVFADAPPDPGGDPTGGTPVGGGSPIGGSLLIMLVLASGYSAKRIWEIRKNL
ncbi:MAG: hypothetical protein K8S16_06675 [Bacteroidales bacterium]|nr:hypothetical protein [Bacteroidales bacterium]